MSEKNWNVLDGKMEYRAGSKAGWVEIKIVKAGEEKVIKLIGKKVDRFFSEDEGADVI